MMALAMKNGAEGNLAMNTVLFMIVMTEMLYETKVKKLMDLFCLLLLYFRYRG